MEERGEVRDKTKILHLITRSDWAGGQKVLYTIVYGLKENYSTQFEIEVACGPESGQLIEELKKINVKVHVIPDLVREISPVKDLRAYFQIKKLIKDGKYDVVHCHSSKAGFLGRIAAKRTGVKNVIYTVHGWWGIEQYKGLKRKLLILAERFAAKFCDKIVLLCHRDLLKAKKWKIGKDSQYVVIPNALIPQPPAARGKLRKELGILENIKIVGNVARLDPQKNPLRFLEIAKLVLEERDDVVFVWIGGSIVDDSYGKLVQKWLDEHPDVAKKVHFLPFRKDAVELMADFDVFLLTSDSEGMPLVVLEALNQGVPVVSTDVGCVNEMIDTVYSKKEDLALNLLKILNGNDYTSHGYKELYDRFIENHISIYRK
ncbi:glycosyltransferase [Thermotoga sp. 38H-to]|uniref:glycosyltransferase n=1 Tax=Thermotoga sp. 38H-to TaxID=1755812 RepID=UPI0013EC5383|nr:glycosyltransferase [Thermotoga sp. 38H-to]KAF2959882.1 glycosyl transferase family 1 [Thermotoga sp. 38H-to]